MSFDFFFKRKRQKGKTVNLSQSSECRVVSYLCFYSVSLAVSRVTTELKCRSCDDTANTLRG